MTATGTTSHGQNKCHPATAEPTQSAITNNANAALPQTPEGCITDCQLDHSKD